MDTIYALSSGSLPSGVAVIRISGARCNAVVEEIAGPLPPPRQMTLRRFRQPGTQMLVDRGLLCRFEAPQSFTGEDCAEIHLHGGPAVVRAALQALASVSGTRMAEAGEFSRRAFENGKLDLTAAEGLADLIAAETETQRRLALGQAEGALRKRAAVWRAEIVGMRARLEAVLDFADEDDVPAEVHDGIWQEMADLASRIGAAAEGNAGEIVRRGYQIVLMGRPNVGKSSLLNALARRDVAIVTPEAGTTRDVLEVHLDLGGYPATIIDTAGIREAEGSAEREGVRRALARSENADLILWLQPAEEEEGPPRLEVGGRLLVLRSKDDGGNFGREGVSVRTAASLASFEKMLVDLVREELGMPEEGVITRERHRQMLDRSRHSLLEAIAAREEGIELVAENLRSAGDAIGRLTGNIDVEELLDVIFAEFCVGK